MDTNKEIGNRIKYRRQQLGWSQEQLGNMLNLNKSTIQRYESGEIKKIKIPILHMLAGVLMVDPNWLALKSEKMDDVNEKKIIMNLGNRIHAKRKEKKLTLEQLANYIGTSKQTIQRYESGIISNIPLDKIEKIAKILDTSPSYLMGWENNIAFKTIENHEEEHIITNYRKLNDEGQNKLIDYSDDLVSCEKYKKIDNYKINKNA